MKIIKLSLYIVMIACVAVSCKKAEGPDLNYYLATPADLSATLEKTTVTATFSYQNDNKVAGFVVDLSFDENFTNIVQSDTLNVDERIVKFENLGYFSQCYVRAKTLAKDIVLNSEYVKTSIKTENILLQVPKADLSTTSATLRWTQPATGTVKTLLLIDNSTGSETEITLSSSDISSQSIRLENLISAVTYTAVLFDGTERKGVTTFTTIDINAAISIKGKSSIYETLQDAIAAAVSGDIINIGIAQYDFSSNGAVDITKDLTIRAVAGASMPELTSQSFNLIGNVTSLKLSGLKLKGTSSYIVVASGLTGTCSVNIENCDLSAATAGLIYVSSSGTGATVGFTMNNTICHDFGYTGGDFIDFRAGNLNKISVKNCTFYNLARDFIRIDANVTYFNSADPITFENCTFDDICHSGRFIYIRSSSSFLVVNKCLLTNKSTSKASGIGTTVTFTNNNVFGSFSNEWGQYVATNTGTTTIDPQYANRGGGDFTLGDETVKTAQQGDLRWIK